MASQPSFRISLHPLAAAVETCRGAEEDLDALSVGVVVDRIVEVVVGGVEVATGAVTVATGVGSVVLGDTVTASPLVFAATALAVDVVPGSSARTWVLVYTTSVFGVDVLALDTGAAIGSQDCPIGLPPICSMIVGCAFK
jgi:hypothetical protein